MNKLKVYEYRLFIKGLFGRNRKVKFESFLLTEDKESQLSVEELEKLLEAKLKELKVKGVALIKVVETPCEIENMDGVMFKSAYIQFNVAPLIQREIVGA